MKRLPVWLLFLCLLAACRGEAPDGAASGGTGQAPAAPAAAPVEPVVLEDVVESDPRYIIGISWPEGIDRYPALAAQLKAYADDARADVLQAVTALGPDTTELYDLALEFKILVDTPELFAVAADGSSYTGGAHGTPLIARFVWLPRQERMLTAQELIPGAGAWQQISSYVREQLHGALSLRVDADDLPPEERERVVRSAGRMIDDGTEPEAGNFAQFEPVMARDGRMAALRFVFPPYQVGPYSDGVQTVEVPAAVLLPHVAATYRPLFTEAIAGQ